MCRQFVSQVLTLDGGYCVCGTTTSARLRKIVWLPNTLVKSWTPLSAGFVSSVSTLCSTRCAAPHTLLRVRVQIIRHARTHSVCEYQSCMFVKCLINCTRTRTERMYRTIHRGTPTADTRAAAAQELAAAHAAFEYEGRGELPGASTTALSGWWCYV